MGVQKIIKINSFGGPIVWLLRKHYSQITSRVMLKYVSKKYSRITRRYIKWFLAQEKPPVFSNIMIETINRCNGNCEFCPANKKDEKRPFKKMSEEMFFRIISQLRQIQFNGKIFMCVNNEPFLDKRILDFSKYAKKELPDSKIAMITNGTLLTPDMMSSMIGTVDQIVINDYSEKYRLSSAHKKVYDYVKKNKRIFKDMSITINRRYTKEILATRAGSAPNKPTKNTDITVPCIYPFTDMVIFPDGKVGICCNDCFETTCFGDVEKQPIKEIWEGPQYEVVRKQMREGRDYSFCKECDVLDAGEREREIRELLTIHDKS